jgi:hypothetical protein
VFRKLYFAAIFFSVSIATYAADTPLKEEGVVSEGISPNVDEPCIGPSGRAITVCAVITEETNVKVRQKKISENRKGIWFGGQT